MKRKIGFMHALVVLGTTFTPAPGPAEMFSIKSAESAQAEQNQTATPEPTAQTEQVYVDPEADSIPTMTIKEAREAFIKGVRRGLSIRQVRFEGDGTQVVMTRPPNSAFPTCTFNLRELKTPILAQFWVNTTYCLFGASSWQAAGPPDHGMPCNERWFIEGEENAEKLADAMNILAQAPAEALRMQDDAAAFDEAVRWYRSQPAKPALPEEARRYKVQGDAAAAEKRYDDALDFYGKAQEIALWWPEGHFNRAILLGDQEDFEGAIHEMKRYLALEPNAPDARAAQDKIYVWESKLQQ